MGIFIQGFPTIPMWFFKWNFAHIINWTLSIVIYRQNLFPMSPEESARGQKFTQFSCFSYTLWSLKHDASKFLSEWNWTSLPKVIIHITTNICFNFSLWGEIMHFLPLVLSEAWNLRINIIASLFGMCPLNTDSIIINHVFSVLNIYAILFKKNKTW